MAAKDGGTGFVGASPGATTAAKRWSGLGDFGNEAELHKALACVMERPRSIGSSARRSPEDGGREASGRTYGKGGAAMAAGDDATTAAAPAAAAPTAAAAGGAGGRGAGGGGGGAERREAHAVRLALQLVAHLV